MLQTLRVFNSRIHRIKKCENFTLLFLYEYKHIGRFLNLHWCTIFLQKKLLQVYTNLHQQKGKVNVGHSQLRKFHSWDTYQFQKNSSWQKYLGRHWHKKIFNFLIKMVLLLATGSVMTVYGIYMSLQGKDQGVNQGLIFGATATFPIAN